MFSLNKWILRHPYWSRLLYFLTVLTFFTDRSLGEDKFYLQAGLLFLLYVVWCRPLFKLVGYDLRRKQLNPGNGFEKRLLLNGSWLFLLIPLKLLVTGWSWGGGGGIRVLLFLVVAGIALFFSVRSLGKGDSGTLLWSLGKNFLLLFLIPISIVLLSPVLFLLFAL